MRLVAAADPRERAGGGPARPDLAGDSLGNVAPTLLIVGGRDRWSSSDSNERKQYTGMPTHRSPAFSFGKDKGTLEQVASWRAIGSSTLVRPNLTAKPASGVILRSCAGRRRIASNR